MSLTNKEKAQIYHKAVSDYDVATIEAMVCENYIQHNPMVPTGRAAFLALIPKLKEHNSKIQNLRIFQDGSHVIMHHLWKNAIPFGAQEKIAFHIIRFDQKGLIAEHWSVMADVGSMIGGTTKISDLEKTETNKALIAKHFSSLVGSKYNRQHKVFGSGNFVLSISEGMQNNKPTAFYDLYRIENEIIAEHWSIYQEIPQVNLANENTMFGF